MIPGQRKIRGIRDSMPARSLAGRGDGAGSATPILMDPDLKDLLDYQANEIDYNNGGSGLAATNVQDAIDELAAREGVVLISGVFYGAPASGDPILGHLQASYALTLPAGLTGSRIECGTAPTGTRTYSIKVDGVEVGTATIAAAATTGTFTFASPVVLDPGERLEVISPVAPDATLADVFVTIVGEK